MSVSSSDDDNRTHFRTDERRQEILSTIEADGRVSVSEIASRFDVSPVTIRSDLNYLAIQGKLKRVRGGAVLLDHMQEVADIVQRMTVNLERKVRIAELANTLVRDGDTIAVDSGSTTFEFVKTLENKSNLTIATYDLRVSNYVNTELPNVMLVMLGGAVRRGHGYCCGPLTTKMIDQLYFDKVFLGTNSFSSDQGFMTEGVQVGETKAALIRHSNISVMLMDSTKTHSYNFIKFADLNDFHYLVMDEDPDHEMQMLCANIGHAPKLMI